MSTCSRLLAVISSLATCLVLLLPGCRGQGRLQMPLGRSSIWRAGVDTPKNFEDHMLECGGLSHKSKHGNQCGMCGDPVDKSRDNEAGGKYDTGMMAASFNPGQRAQMKVLMMSNHGGFFEFKMCPTKPATQACFDSNPIQMADGSGTRWYMPEGVQGVMSVDVIMPSMTCQSCVMQWTYTGSNDWGPDGMGNDCMGCGPQYEIRNCADVMLMPGGESQLHPAVQKYNDADNGGQNPMGTFYFDPWASPSDNGMNMNTNMNMNNQQGGSPFVEDPWNNPSPPRRPMGNNQVDPWVNPPQMMSPARDPWMNQARPTPAPRRPMGNSQPDPWTNPPPMGNRDPWMNQANPAPWRPMGNNRPDPWTNPPPMRGNNPMDPWPNAQRVTPAPRMRGNNNNGMDPWPGQNPAPGTMGRGRGGGGMGMGNNAGDPWTNPPSRVTPAPRMTGNNQRDPWPGTPRQPPRNNQMDPWPNNQRMQNNNQRDPWPNTQRMGNNNQMNSRQNNQRRRNNNQMDPWPNTQQMQNRMNSRPTNQMRGNNQRDPWPANQMRGNNQGDPWPANQMRGNNQRDPWPANQMRGNNQMQRDPWPANQMRGNNQGDPWPANQMRGNNQGDPWPNAQQRNPPQRMMGNQNSGIPYAPPIGNQADDPWMTMDEIPTDSIIYNVEVQSRDVMMQPSMSCVAIGQMRGKEGMDQWCTDNCNLSYCPEAMCAC